MTLGIASPDAAFAEERSGPRNEGNTQTIVESHGLSLQVCLPAEFAGSSDAQIAAQLPTSVPYESEGFSGEIALAGFEAHPHYIVDERQVERVQAYPGLPTRDVAQLPLEKDYELLDGVSLGSKSWVSLQYTAVQWTSDDTDADGRPDSFTGYVTYRGIERELMVDYIEVDASYFGEVTKTVAVPAVVPPAAPVSIQAPPTPTTAAPARALAAEEPIGPEFPLAALVIGAVCVVLLGLGLALFLARYYNARLVQYRDDGHSRTLLRRHLRLSEGTARMVLPLRLKPWCQGSEFVVLVKPRLAAQNGCFELVWQHQLLLKRPLAAKIDVSQAFERDMVLATAQALAAGAV